MTFHCYYCGKVIHFDPDIKSETGKSIPLSGEKGTSKHRCKANPFNKDTRRQYAKQKNQKQKQQKSKSYSSNSTWQEDVEEELRQWYHSTIGTIPPKYLVTLGLPADCKDMNKIKNAYRKLALQYHPDRNHEPDAKDKFIRIQDAYDQCCSFLTH